MSESDSPQPVASEAEIDALEYVVHQGIIGAYDRPVLLAWLARLQRTPAEPSTRGEGTRRREGTSEPVAWVAFADDASESGVTALNRQAVEEVAAKMGWHVAPLYRSPTLTDAERFVLREVRDACADKDDVKANEIAAVIDGLLERTSNKGTA